MRQRVKSVNPSIRKATIEDMAAITDLASELGYPAAPEVMRNRLITILGRSDHLVLVAMSDNGAVHGGFRRTPRTSSNRDCESISLGW